MTHACTLKEAHDLLHPRGQVLIIEDDADVSGLLAEVIRDSGFPCETAHDGREALDQVLACEPRLILLDLRMPKMDGWQFVQQLKRRFPSHKPAVVLVSAHPDLNQEARALDATHFLQKPFHVDDVVRLAQRYC
jgi:two-component system, response regulator, stage 0 sporulation protein F